MNIGVIGVGGVGGYFGTKICVNSDERNDVYFLARGEHLSKIKENGLVLETVEDGIINCKPKLASDGVSEWPNLDICLICVKAFDLDSSLDMISPKITDDTLILPLLNGVDVYERIRNKIKKGIVFPSTVYVGTHIEKPGKVNQKGGSCKIFIAKDPKNMDADNTRLIDTLKESNIKFEWTGDDYSEIWKKYAFITSYGLVTSEKDVTIGEAMENDEYADRIKCVISEISDIAKNIYNKEIFSVEDIYNTGSNFPYETKTSFHRDFNIKNKKDERDLFGGTLLRMSRKYSTEAKVSEEVYDNLNKMKQLV